MTPSELRTPHLHGALAIPRLQDDLAAIKVGLTLAWSNGVTESHIHRLKLMKRQG
jgi:transposase